MVDYDWWLMQGPGGPYDDGRDPLDRRECERCRGASPDCDVCDGCGYVYVENEQDFEFHGRSENGFH